MAYNLGSRFPPPPKYVTLLDPGAYQRDKPGRKQNAVPFLSKTPRNTLPTARLWTQAIYNQSLPRNIPNCSSMLFKLPRFPYEAFSAEDLEELLCKCGILNPCECPTGQEKQEDVICRAKVRRRIFKGPFPRSILGDEGLSATSKRDYGFCISTCGSQHRIRKQDKEDCPPFYNARVNESTAFYQGCKWSRRTATRAQKNLEVRPGPADYSLEREPAKNKICEEKHREFKRKTTTQMRYMDMLQRRSMLEVRPGPTAYYPILPKGSNLKYLGSKSERFFVSKYDVGPGPADHWLRRDFDPIESTDIFCHAKLPEPPCFGLKTKRFKTQREEGPGPASYDVNLRLCKFDKCGTAPFGTSAKRFKEEIIESDEEEILETPYKDNYEQTAEPCAEPTWQFKSKTIRMKPLVKKTDEAIPYLPGDRNIIRSSQSQYIAPFLSSDGRFQQWYNWIPVQGRFETPGPGSYCIEKPRCIPAVMRGPLSRAERFPTSSYKTPSPNEYTVYDGIETILATHNNILKRNIENQHKFKWEPPKPKKVLSFKEREELLFKNSILLLEPEEEVPKIAAAEVVKNDPVIKPKMLRTFLYANPLPNYY